MATKNKLSPDDEHFKPVGMISVVKFNKYISSNNWIQPKTVVSVWNIPRLYISLLFITPVCLAVKAYYHQMSHIMRKRTFRLLRWSETQTEGKGLLYLTKAIFCWCEWVFAHSIMSPISIWNVIIYPKIMWRINFTEFYIGKPYVKCLLL